MNWLTLVALSAAGASGAVDGGSTIPSEPAAAIAPAAEEGGAEVELDGVVLTRPSGGFLQLKMDGVRLVLRSYDDKKQPVAIDVDRATVRLQFASRSPEQLTLVPSDDGQGLVAVKPLRAPHVFRANIVLLRGESSDAVETYQVAYP